MYIENFDINKDWFAYLCCIYSCIGAIIVPYLVWYFGDLRTESIKERKQQIAIFDYLVIAANIILFYS